eukprot:TRINITY_DN21501_c0_g1_i1.p1 TRINITY_DN21501_c0_g1~~TRINITY_DN21501_c0_g1_i1.p1  ORF type:complete len:307 (+),score=66.21 TRINITY_DN21501_c0_g1_i1:317-1237(+)
MKGETTNRIVGVTRNPFNPENTVGGSSGGSAVAISTGIGHVSIANDGAGSVRVPAANCGIVGVKPPINLLLSAGGQEYVTNLTGTMSRKLLDSAIVFDVNLESHHFEDPPEICFLPKFPWNSLDPKIEEVFYDALGKLKQIFPHQRKINDLGFADPTSSADILWEDTARLLYRTTHSSEKHLLDTCITQVENHPARSSQEIADADSVRTSVATSISNFFARHPKSILVTPTLPVLPWKAGQPRPVPSNKLSDFSWNPYTYIFNWSNSATMTVPMANVKHGSYDQPVGLQIIVGKEDGSKEMKSLFN